jgi:iron complex transport system ATP-binding protein
MLEVRDITVRYDTREILRDVSLTLQSGQMIALVGANGAGKTTLIRAMNGTLPLSAGRIELDGRPIAGLSRREIAQRIAVVAQENETRFPVTVIDFVLAGRFASGKAFGWETARDLEFAENALQSCDLDGYHDRLMDHLSGGERQRVVLARALAAGSMTLLLDEPTANLDLSHQAMMFRLVRKRCADCGCSAVVITHDLNLAAEFADEIVMLKDGKIAAKGTPAEVLIAENVIHAFGVDVLLDRHPVSGNVRVTSVF